MPEWTWGQMEEYSFCTFCVRRFLVTKLLMIL